MARVDHLIGGIYRISTYAPESRISFNQFLIDDDEPALIHTGTFPIYAGVRAAAAQVLDPSRLRYVIVAHFEADECGGMGRFVAEAPQSMLASSAVGAGINLEQWYYAGGIKGMQDGDFLHLGRHRLRFRCASLGFDDGGRRDDRESLPFRLVHSAKRSTQHRSREFGNGHVRILQSSRHIRRG
jgi:flavorubredoxin